MQGEKYKIMAKDWLSDSLNLRGVIKPLTKKINNILIMSFHLYLNWRCLKLCRELHDTTKLCEW